ncbi:hypothetical protein KZZ52_00385 [Dactylosporangium sp. AC04546]|uniref:hypothetical protein n=1 Tax=Dactylosporangium sp. AC04546 TaxID=2862460 RepID=UPI001EDCF7F5|nr:hypothetical protein [Dactylosporangium sp. AC04546]WVK83947.1 hypothetical protein KZZ52_00385 [Dactylosporangium sp. AC04546]
MTASWHPEWCAGGHRCGLGEHRAEPITLDAPGLGRVVLTRVRSSTGREHAEVRLTVTLDRTETVARQQLLALTRDLDTVLTRALYR